jgi:hypothetical protein
LIHWFPSGRDLETFIKAIVVAIKITTATTAYVNPVVIGLFRYGQK